MERERARACEREEKGEGVCVKERDEIVCNSKRNTIALLGESHMQLAGKAFADIARRGECRAELAGGCSVGSARVRVCPGLAAAHRRQAFVLLLVTGPQRLIT